MAIVPIIKYGDPILRKKCASVKKIGPDEKKLFEDMVDTMHFEKGVGLAAPQVGICKQLIVVDIGEGAIKLANPRILKRKGKSTLEEGCLSLPGIKVIIKRAKEIILEGINEKNQKVNIRAAELLAHIFQHEIDHLKGKLIIDHIGLIDKIRIKGKLKRLKKVE
ncbi:peptide deformylase [Candidatus Desantisbacteria bacterium CG1_02_38_46]|uniref:Peptide deformylase n=2 Tax=unclassified Candidatus Desantisiibacteriota TaxID=3106372 RepID=A0A2H9PBZ9_9BACT|nr:MAG: peptide deformylase [Candidatus Desantisbacteria bacterium CG1_02_38_46]PIZ16544.1 MAG: peptide deformylase [Candidatus Desantisbacteria bacterium CG_4_10_14_0_8_um_filter_39_17]